MQAAVGAVRCYLALHDAPAAAAAATAADEASLAALSPEERKKEKLRRKKVRGCYNICYVTYVLLSLVACPI
jgi:hypothetical protein